MTAEILLSRLEKVRQTKPDNWIARCPAHADHTPSLAIRELPDGRVLIKCFTGCGVDDIMAAVGLELSDLFPERLPTSEPERRSKRQGFDALTVLKSLSHEITVAIAAVGTLQQRGWLNDDEVDRMATAADRITGASAYVER